MSEKRGHIDAFTIFEVTVVVAIMGILITIISNTLNRFNEQLKFSNDVHQELNEWFAFRSNLWKELYMADSIRQTGKEIEFFLNDRIVKYKTEDEQLFRFQSGQWKETPMRVERIGVVKDEEEVNVIFDFLWKGQVMTLDYYYKPDVKNEINSYFDHLK